MLGDSGLLAVWHLSDLSTPRRYVKLKSNIDAMMSLTHRCYCDFNDVGLVSVSVDSREAVITRGERGDPGTRVPVCLAADPLANEYPLVVYNGTVR